MVWMRLCQTRDAQDNVATRVYGEGEYQISGAKKSVYLSDQLGSVRDVVDADSGALLGALDYRPYGQVYRQVGDKPLYQYGQLLWEPTVELNVSPTRLYNAAVGRWMSRDPIREKGGINLYGYVGGSPTMGIDPDGLQVAIPPPLIPVAIGGVVGLGIWGIQQIINHTPVPHSIPGLPPIINPSNSTPSPTASPTISPTPTASPKQCKLDPPFSDRKNWPRACQLLSQFSLPNQDFDTCTYVCRHWGAQTTINTTIEKGKLCEKWHDLVPQPHP
jgi:RHS repeat-associated protein